MIKFFVMFPKDILLKVSRPGRYINYELNAYHRNLNEVKLKFCLAYPDLYEVGMSNLGFRIIYDLLNRQPDILCERAFLPWVDLECFLRKQKLVLSSLESEIPLKNFDILGISLHSELNYTGVLNLLNLGQIPLLSEERKDNFPLIIAGGSACFNPEPLANFIDVFVIGEGEEVILEIVNICKDRIKQIRDGEGRKELFLELASLEGVYVPSLYNVEYTSEGKINKFYPLFPEIPQKIKKRIVIDLNNAPYPEKTVVPYIEIIHDRMGIEIMRGCPHRCRFCQARNIYYPRRERSPEKIKELVWKNFLSSGYEEISLLSLSSLDHGKIKDIFSTLSRMFKNQGVGISLSSLRVNKVMKDLLKEYQGLPRTGLTFAPEAGSERLRRIINKRIDLELLYEIAEDIFNSGWRSLKLYFMLGLPGENGKDLKGIVEMAYKILMIKKRKQGNSGRIHLSFNTFIPKPHTTFQWLPLEEEKEWREKRDYLKGELKHRLLRYDFSNYAEDWLEALLSKGDRRLGEVILKAWEKGARFEGWREQFNPSLWQEALKESKIDPYFYIYRKRELSEIFPWDFIETGVSKEELIMDYQAFEKYLALDNNSDFS
ncbi:MAG: TIGR03960 family B12-binding radical SAM protein [Candidatus Omnitrophica bacterium]|nr:TIGR03960 family B12-binding radical SAM protein [Candidatus Omnitrophota bacterium]